MPISEPHIFPFLNFKIQLTKKFKIIIACKNHHKEHRNIPFLILLLNSRRGNQWAHKAELLLDSTGTTTNREWPCAPRAPGNIEVNFFNTKGWTWVIFLLDTHQQQMHIFHVLFTSSKKQAKNFSDTKKWTSEIILCDVIVQTLLVKKNLDTLAVVQKHYNVTSNSKINQQQNQSKHEVKL
jgi:hypothetical protein